MIMASGFSDLSEIQKASRTYGTHHKPPKIDLLNEQPRRDSIIEQQLSGSIIRPEAPSNSQLEGSKSYIYPSMADTQLDATGGLFADSGTSAGFDHCREYQMESNKNRNTLTDRGILLSHVQSTSQSQLNKIENLEAELASKEAALKREIAYMNLHHNPWSRPKQIREPRKEPQARIMRTNQRWLKECPSPSTSRPTSRASSTKTTTEADLLEKTSRLLQEVEEIEKKPLNQQQILIEGGIRKVSSPVSETPSSVHTAIIKVPKREVNNKSPLPFSYDNFSTLGVRGNIASVGAAEPDTPYPPIFPTIKRTQ